MRLAATLAALSFSLAACHEAPTSPYTRVSGPAPSGIPVTLRIDPPTRTPFAGPPIVTEGDSVTASAEFNVSGCVDYTAAAGRVGSSVVITIIETEPDVPRVCALIAQRAVFHAVVRPAPRGSYAVVLRERMEWPTDGPVEREWARGSVALP